MSNPIVILGGGISGLSCAYYLQKLGASALQGRNIIVIEANKHLGGWMKTERCDDDVLHELGPRCLRFAGKLGSNTLNMVEDIGLASEVVGVPVTSKAAQARFIWAKGKMNLLPTSIFSMFLRRPPLTKSLIYYAKQEMRKPRLNLGEKEDISVHEFVKLRFGDELADYFADPLVRGITGGNARRLSMRAMFGEVFDMERTAGSVVKGYFQQTQGKPEKPSDQLFISPGELSAIAMAQKWSTWNFVDGMQRLPEGLCTYLQESKGIPVQIYNETRVKKLEFNKTPGVPVSITVETAEGEISIDAEHVFSGLPASQLAKTLPVSNNDLKSQLQRIDTVNMGLVCLEFEGKDVLKPDTGFGFLAPSTEKDSKVLGFTYDSCVFPVHDAGKNITRITAMIGGEWFEELLGPAETASKQQLLEIALEAANRQLGFTKAPLRSIVKVHQNCIPQYRLNHGQLVEDIRKSIGKGDMKLELLGSSYSGVAVNEIIMNSHRAANRYMNSLAPNIKVSEAQN